MKGFFSKCYQILNVAIFCAMKYVLAFILNELESSSRYLGYRAMHKKLLIKGFIIDHEIMRLILRELNPLSVEQRAQHSLTRRPYDSTGPNQT